MSPEQLRGEGTTSSYSDVFSLGVVLAYAATGRGAFDAPDVPAVIYRILNDPPLLGPLPADLRDIIGACLAKDPAGQANPG